MVSQKRRRFLIKQKQSRRTRLKKTISNFDKVTKEYVKVWVMLRSINDRATAPTAKEIAFIKERLAYLEPKTSLVFTQSVGNEKRFGKDRLTIPRHSLKGLMSGIPEWADRIKAKTGDSRLVEMINATRLKK